MYINILSTECFGRCVFLRGNPSWGPWVVFLAVRVNVSRFMGPFGDFPRQVVSDLFLKTQFIIRTFKRIENQNTAIRKEFENNNISAKWFPHSR